MDAQIKEKWLEALRSKRYRQTTGKLREEISNKKHGYCCLGVLCHTLGSNWRSGVPVLGEVIMEANYAAYLSDEASKMVGLDRATQERLATMNDEGYRFPEIADYIEKHL